MKYTFHSYIVSIGLLRVWLVAAADICYDCHRIIVSSRGVIPSKVELVRVRLIAATGICCIYTSHLPLTGIFYVYVASTGIHIWFIRLTGIWYSLHVLYLCIPMIGIFYSYTYHSYILHLSPSKISCIRIVEKHIQSK